MYLAARPEGGSIAEGVGAPRRCGFRVLDLCLAPVRGLGGDCLLSSYSLRRGLSPSEVSGTKDEPGDDELRGSLLGSDQRWRSTSTVCFSRKARSLKAPFKSISKS